MNKKLLIFGTGLLGEMANYYFEKDSEYSVEAFVTEDALFSKETFCEKPIIPFSVVKNEYSPKKYDIFVAIGYTDLNRNRERIFNECKECEYSLASYVSSKANVYDTLSLGENCLFLEDVTIQPFAKVGNDVIIWNGSHICHHSVIEDHCFIASHVVVSGGSSVGKNCFIGMNSAIRDCIKVGDHCLIGANSWINKDANPYGFYSNEGTRRIKDIT